MIDAVVQPARVAAIDCGTNSIRMLVLERDRDGRVRELDRSLRLTRLGQGVDQARGFHPDALARTFAAVDEYRDRLAMLHVDTVRFVATSAARDARNREEFFTGIQQRLGVLPDIVTGAQEARLSFLGALAAGIPDAQPGGPADVLVMDIGGGSTELVLGSPDGVIAHAVSMDVGSVRLRERFFHHDPVTTDEIDAATVFINGLLDDSGVDFARVATFVGVGGTTTSLSALHQHLPRYDRAKVHGSMMTGTEIDVLAATLLSRTVAEICEYPSMQPERADVLAGGALICTLVASRVSVPMLVSEADILDGIALELLGH